MFGGKFEELLIVLLIILVLFGAKKLPELARSLGTSAREIRKGFNDDDTDADTAKSSTKKPA